jgi:hypothetical protein
VIAAKKWVLPPGYRVLADFVQEHGHDHAQNELMSGRSSAFKLHLNTGDLEPILATAWCVARGRSWLEKAASGESVHLGPPPPTGNFFQIVHYAVIVQVKVSEQQAAARPPDVVQPHAAGRKRGAPLAKELMAAVFPEREWRRMGIRAVRKRCAPTAKAWGMPLPSPDSFSRAMGRRRK